jgi:hypothetical protein
MKPIKSLLGGIVVLIIEIQIVLKMWGGQIVYIWFVNTCTQTIYWHCICVSYTHAHEVYFFLLKWKKYYTKIRKLQVEDKRT